MGKKRIWQQTSAIISAKLGRCSFCMGLALSGAVIGWAALVAVVSFWPAFPFLNFLALWPVGFTALWLLHIATFGARVVTLGRQETNGPTISRRRMVGVFANGVGLAILASAVSASKVLAAPKSSRCCCAGTGLCPCAPVSHGPCVGVGGCPPNLSGECSNHK
jgi:hypothetical protein